MMTSPHIPIKFRQRHGDPRLREFKDGIQPRNDFPSEARAVPSVEGEEGRVGFREDVGAEGGDGDVVAEFLDFVGAAGGGAEDFEDHAGGVGEERIARHRHTDDHSIRIVESLFTRTEGDEELKIATSGEAGFPGELVLSQIGKVPRDALVV